MDLSHQFPLFLALAVILFSLGLLWLILAALERMRGGRDVCNRVAADRQFLEARSRFQRREVADVVPPYAHVLKFG